MKGQEIRKRRAAGAVPPFRSKEVPTGRGRHHFGRSHATYIPEPSIPSLLQPNISIVVGQEFNDLLLERSFSGEVVSDEDK